jgi:hypothetical protein
LTIWSFSFVDMNIYFFHFKFVFVHRIIIEQGSTSIYTLMFVVGFVLLIFLVFWVVHFCFVLSSSCVLCSQCFQCHWIVHSWWSLRYFFHFKFVFVHRIIIEQGSTSIYTLMWSFFVGMVPAYMIFRFWVFIATFVTYDVSSVTGLYILDGPFGFL